MRLVAKLIDWLAGGHWQLYSSEGQRRIGLLGMPMKGRWLMHSARAFRMCEEQILNKVLAAWRALWIV